MAVLLTVAASSSRSVSGPKAGSGRTTAAVRVLSRKRRAKTGVAFIVPVRREGANCMIPSLKLGRSENGNENDRGGKQEQRGEPSHSYNKGTVTSLAQLTTASDHECRPRKAEAL